MKRFALQALLALAFTVALCMFFAGTVRTITTAKVKLILPKNGKLEVSQTLKGELVFPETEEMRLDEAKTYPLLIEKVFVRPGYEVKKGDVLFTATLTDAQEKLDKLKESIDEKVRKLDDLDIKNRRLGKTSERNRFYEEMVAAHGALSDARLVLRVRAALEGVTLPDMDAEATDKATDKAADEAADEATQDPLKALESSDASSELLSAARAYLAAKTKAADAEEALFGSYKLKKYNLKEGVWDYVKERTALVAEIDDLEGQSAEILLAEERLSEITAPRDGFVVSLTVKAGDAFDGKNAVCVLNKEGSAPVLRVDTSAARQAVTTGATVRIAANYDSLETTVAAMGVDAEGKKYVDVQLTDAIVQSKGGVYALMLQDTEMTVSTRADASTTLVPASAVRSEGENDSFVYQINWNYGGFTGSRMTVSKTPVTVIARGDKMVSIAEDLSNAQLADKEDRAIKDGDTVMEYVD